MISRKTTKIAALLAILSIAGFFIYKGVAGPMKINMPETNPVRLNSGLVGYWTFDGQDVNIASPYSVTDKSPAGGNNGTLSFAGTGIRPYPTPGKIGQGLYFEGTDGTNLNAGYISVPTTSLGISPPLSISVWVYPKTASENGSVIFEARNKYRFGLSKSDGTVTMTDNDTGTFQTAAGAVTMNAWNHIVVTLSSTTISPSTAKIYVNNVSSASSLSGTWAPSGTYNWVAIGSRNGGEKFFNGAMDEVRVYSRALSASEITELYNQGR